MKKVLILHTSVGLGHKSMAENIAWHLQSAGLEVRLADIGQVQRGRFEKVVVIAHQFINLHLPFVWAWLYAWGHYVIYPFRVFIARFNSTALKKLVLEFQPDLIISDHTTSSAVVTYLRRARVYNKLFGIAFSDYHLHPYWLYKGADFYLANIIEQKTEMVKRGIPANKIFVCGMTLKPKLTVDVNAVKQKLNIEPRDKVILVGSGSLGTGFKEGLLDILSKIANAKVLVVCGKNKIYKKHLEEKFVNTNILPLSYYSPMGELYAIADAFFTKPGGLTVAESLQYNLPIIVTHILPGQEQLNLDYLLAKGLVEQVSESVTDQISQTNSRKAGLQANPNVKPIINSDISVKDVVLGKLG